MDRRRPFFFLASLIAALALLAADANAASGHSNRKSLRPAQSRDAKLSALYDALAKAPSAEIAKLIEYRIDIARLQSGSATADLLMARARVSIEAKDNRLALELLDAVVDLAPNFVEARAQRATLYYETKDIPRALADLGVTVAKDPKHYGAMTGLGIIFEELGEDRLALEAFRRALAVDPFIEGVEEHVKKLAPSVEGRDL